MPESPTPTNAGERAVRSESFLNMRLQGYTYREIGEQYGVSRERVRQVLEPISPTLDPQFVQAAKETRRALLRPPKPPKIPRTDKSWQRSRMRMHKDLRRELVKELKVLAATLGRNPTTKEVTAHFEKHWQTLARYFVGKSIRGDVSYYSKGYHRWFRVAGLTPRVKIRRAKLLTHAVSTTTEAPNGDQD